MQRSGAAAAAEILCRSDGPRADALKSVYTMQPVVTQCRIRVLVGFIQIGIVVVLRRVASFFYRAMLRMQSAVLLYASRPSITLRYLNVRLRQDIGLHVGPSLGGNNL